MDKNKPVHPGEVLLEEFLKPRGMSCNQLAQLMVVTAPRLNDIVWAGAELQGTAL